MDNKMTAEQALNEVRKSFERWAPTAGMLIDRDKEGKYEQAMTRHYWLVWQAAKSDTEVAAVVMADPDGLSDLLAGKRDNATIYRTKNDWKAGVPLFARPALSAPRVPAGWQPIETVPMDGTAVLVMRDIWPGTKSGRAEECNGHNTYVAEWWSEEGHGGKWVCYMDAVLDQVCPIVPTHWMPLPHPPSMLAASPEPVADSQQVIDDLRAEVATLRQLVKDTCEDMECEPDCDSFGHSESCPVANPVHAWRKLRAEVEALRALESALAEFEADTEALPLGHESKSNGASTYNWRVRMVAELREKAARLRKGGA